MGLLLETRDDRSLKADQPLGPGGLRWISGVPVGDTDSSIAIGGLILKKIGDGLGARLPNSVPVWKLAAAIWSGILTLPLCDF